ncbi:MAG: hypothetical protein ACPGN3_07990 [Opitutales bacterium]
MARIFLRKLHFLTWSKGSVDFSPENFESKGMVRLYEKFTRGRLLSAAIVTVLMMLGGCYTLEQATISKNSMSNGQVGYNGYKISVPHGYVSIDDPSVADLDFSFLRESSKEQIHSFSSSALIRDVHHFYNRDREAIITVKVSEKRGGISRAFSDTVYYESQTVSGQPVKNRMEYWYANAQERIYTNVVGEWEKISGEGTAAFLKSGYFNGSNRYFAGCVLYGNYNEAFFISGEILNGDLETIRRDVIATVSSLQL